MGAKSTTALNYSKPSNNYTTASSTVKARANHSSNKIKLTKISLSSSAITLTWLEWTEKKKFQETARRSVK